MMLNDVKWVVKCGQLVVNVMSMLLNCWQYLLVDIVVDIVVTGFHNTAIICLLLIAHWSFGQIIVLGRTVSHT